MTLPTILIVDDDIRGRTLLTSVLETENYRLITADNGLEALTFAASHRPDVVLLDVMMPDMDGFEVCRLLRKDPSLIHLPIILVTALDDRKSRLKGIEVGADDFITKPIDTLEIRVRLRALTRMNRFRLLSEEHARFEQIVSSSPDGIVIAEPTGKILMLNRALRALLPEGTDPTDLFALFAQEDLPVLRSRIADSHSPVHRIAPLEMTLRDNSRTILEVTVSTLPWQGRTACQLVIRDVSERKNLEVQLMRSQRIDLLGQLAGGIVHDVNNILASISAHAALISMDVDTAETPKRLAAIETAAHRGAGLLRQMLMFARGADAEIVRVEPCVVLNEFSVMVREALGKKITVEIETPPQLPSIHADVNQVHQVLMNLCVNARDAIATEGRIQVTADCRRVLPEHAPLLPHDARPGDYVVFSIRDNGSGIPPEVREKLFEPFFTTKPAGQGTGLGLATVLRVMKRHHGFITLESEVGQGTCFSCYFPMEAEMSAQRLQESSAY